jgi:hypothetical protein
MNVTGLIYVILIAVWGVVLVPRWLRRHDESKRFKDRDRMAAALAHDSNHDLDGIEDGHADQQRAATWGEYLRGFTHMDISHYTEALSSKHRGGAAFRRRRVLTILGSVTLVSLVGSLAGFLPGSVMALATLALIGYVSAMFYQLRRKELGLTGHVGHDLEVDSGLGEHAQTASVGLVDGVRVVDPSDTWEPRETTLPTYVSKTKASKIPRRIDLTSGWTGADMVAQAREQQASPELREQFTREWSAVQPDEDAEVAQYAQGYDQDKTYYRRAVNE